MIKKPFWKWLKQLPKEFWEGLKDPLPKGLIIFTGATILCSIGIEVGGCYHRIGYLLILPAILMILYVYWLLDTLLSRERQKLEMKKQ